MELINKTPATADFLVANPDDDNNRILIVAAKATFKVHADGGLSWDTDDPFPVLLAEDETDFGILPPDLLPPNPAKFEVCILGRAYAPGPETTEMDVSFKLGENERKLRVIGDRIWQGEGDSAGISTPAPFGSMPLTWDRAFGGSAEVYIDQDSPLDSQDPRNPFGRGFDPMRYMADIVKALQCPPGYPVCSSPRQLPNIESPDQPVLSWDDHPKPVCWAPLSTTSSMYLERYQDLPEDGAVDSPSDEESHIPPRLKGDWLFRAPDELLFELPAKQSEVVVTGMSPDGIFSFQLPDHQFLLDYCVGERQGTVELRPQMLVLLPEQKKFYQVFKGFFSYEFIGGEERSLRLRIQNG